MNRIAASIRNRLSLRPPQADSLEILAILADALVLQKNADPAPELEKVKGSYPTCTDFERNFPSICFALATGAEVATRNVTRVYCGASMLPLFCSAVLVARPV